MVANRPLIYRDGDGQIKELAEGLVVNETTEAVGGDGSLVSDSSRGSSAVELALPALKRPASTDKASALKNNLRPRWTVENYLAQVPAGRRTLVVGCGAVEQGDVCSNFKVTHEFDFTVDVNPKIQDPDLLADLATFRGTDLGRYALGKFDIVRFEYVCRGCSKPFKDEQTQAWIQAAHELLRPEGRVDFYYCNDQHGSAAMKELGRLGYDSISREYIPLPPDPAERKNRVQGIKPVPTLAKSSRLSSWFGRASR
jgi:hypothetical protein